MKPRNLEVLNPILRKSHVHTETTKHEDREWKSEIIDYQLSKTPKCYMMIGIPASGKSTYAKKLQHSNPDVVYISTDHIIEEYAKLQNTTYNSVFNNYYNIAQELMYKELDNAVNNEKDIIWDQTNLTIKSRRKKLNKLVNYRKIAVVCETPDDATLSARLSNRQGKHISQRIIAQMKGDFTYPEYSEGFELIIKVK
jgi:predicted kinase